MVVEAGGSVVVVLAVSGVEVLEAGSEVAGPVAGTELQPAMVSRTTAARDPEKELGVRQCRAMRGRSFHPEAALSSRESPSAMRRWPSRRRATHR